MEFIKFLLLLTILILYVFICTYAGGLIGGGVSLLAEPYITSSGGWGNLGVIVLLVLGFAAVGFIAGIVLFVKRLKKYGGWQVFKQRGLRDSVSFFGAHYVFLLILVTITMSEIYL